MKIAKTIAMVALVAGIFGTAAYYSGHADTAEDSTVFAVAGFVLIALSSVLRRRKRRSL